MHSDRARDDKIAEICMGLDGVLLLSLKFAGNLNMKGMSTFLLTLYVWIVRTVQQTVNKALTELEQQEQLPGFCNYSASDIWHHL